MNKKQINIEIEKVNIPVSWFECPCCKAICRGNDIYVDNNKFLRHKCGAKIERKYQNDNSNNGKKNK